MRAKAAVMIGNVISAGKHRVLWRRPDSTKIEKKGILARRGSDNHPAAVFQYNTGYPMSGQNTNRL